MHKRLRNPPAPDRNEGMLCSVAAREGLSVKFDRAARLDGRAHVLVFAKADRDAALAKFNDSGAALAWIAQRPRGGKR